MSDLIGHTVGQYQIVERIGQGGMAVVFKAWQRSARRYVALKVLPAHLALDATLVERFRREAEAAARLAHPNIVRIYEVGEARGLHYIAMEYLEGQDLATVIAREGALPLDRVLRIVDQISSALDYAHHLHYVHRDVKPSNIFVGPNDRVTLTDFGIVKAAADSRLTRTGAIIGTPEYMSPEQAQGLAVDKYSDLYSLGVVLYELLTGRVPFRANTPVAVLYKQVHEAPRPPTEVNPRLPRQVESVVLRALSKDRAGRYRSARQMVGALARAVPSAAQVPPPTRAVRRAESAASQHAVPGGRQGSRVGVFAIALGALLLVLFLLTRGASFFRSQPTPTATYIAFVTEVVKMLPPTATPRPSSPAVVTSPATPTTTETVASPTPSPITVVPTESPLPTPVPVPLAPPVPAGKIAFASGDAQGIWLHVLYLDSGDVQKFADLGNFSGGMVTKANAPQYTWSPNGDRIAYVYGPYQSYDALHVMAVAGGGEASLPSENGTTALAWSPDGRQLLYIGFDSRWLNRIWTVDMQSRDRRILVDNQRGEQYRGMSWAPDGSRLAVISNLDDLGNHRLWVMNADGSNPRLLTPSEADHQSPTWSPDGKQIAFSSNRDGNYEIYVVDQDGSNLRRLTESPNSDFAPSWSPDSNWIAFCSDREGIMTLYIMDSEGGNLRRLVSQHGMIPVWGR